MQRVTPGVFARDTAISPIGSGRYAGAICKNWDIGGNANGGYLLALAARAMVAETGVPDPVTITAHYLSPGKVGPVEAEVHTVRRGRRFAVATASLTASGKPLIQVLGTFGELGASAGVVERIDAAPPDLPTPESCVRHDPGGGAPRLYGSIDLRLHPADAGFKHGDPSGLLLSRGWFRLLGDEPMDALALLLAVDAFPPAVFNGCLPVAWTPTLELTVHLRARPAPGWLRACFTTRFVSAGFLEEDGEIWDVENRLVAQSRQLALVPHVEG